MLLRSVANASFHSFSTMRALPSVKPAVNAFVRQAVREGKIPFELKGDERAFWDKAEERAWAAVKRAQSPDARWFSTDEVFGEMDGLFGALDAGETP